MKILAFTDIHGHAKNLGYVSASQTLKKLDHFKKTIKENDIDFAICCGDITYFGEEIEAIMKKIGDLGVDVLLIHGNHEEEDEVRLLSKKYDNIHFLHGKMEKIGNFVFIGYGGGGFSRRDSEFVETMKTLTNKLDKKEKIVLFTHAPPHGTKIDFRPPYGHVGNIDYREFIEKHNVVLAMAGHIHEGFGLQQKLGKTTILDPGPDGKIIDLE